MTLPTCFTVTTGGNPIPPPASRKRLRTTPTSWPCSARNIYTNMARLTLFLEYATGIFKDAAPKSIFSSSGRVHRHRRASCVAVTYSRIPRTCSMPRNSACTSPWLRSGLRSSSWRFILKWLNSLPNTKAIKVHGSQYMEAGTPDIICVHHGTPYFLEAKQPGKKPTKIQKHRLSQWTEAGALCHVVTSLTDVREMLSSKDDGAD